MPSFTPGPWRVEAEDYAPNYGILAQQGPLTVCPAIAHGEADAYLIAAAPDLAQSVRDLLALHEAHHNHPVHAAGRAALAKAGER